MLTAHAAARGHLLDVQALAKAAGSQSPNYTYAQYGRLGHDIARVLGYRHKERIWTRVLAVDTRSRANDLVQWRLHPEVVKAVQAVGWRGGIVRPDPLEEVQRAARALEGLTDTTREALVEARLGQGAFRQALVSQWRGCAVTGCELLEALRASHIKPWHVSTNRERLDANNGLLLIATLDALFDSGLISFNDSGTVIYSPRVPVASRLVLGLKPGLRLRRLKSGMRSYLAWHRRHVFADAG